MGHPGPEAGIWALGWCQQEEPRACLGMFLPRVGVLAPKTLAWPQRQPIWLMSSDRSGAHGGQSFPPRGHYLWRRAPEAHTLAPGLEKEQLQG